VIARSAKRTLLDEHLLQAARQLTYEHGPDVSMSSIASTVGVSVGTIYTHFDSKHGLMVASALDGFSKFADKYRPLVEGADDPAAAVSLFFRLLCRLPITDPVLASVVYHYQRFMWTPENLRSEENVLIGDLRAGVLSGRFNGDNMIGKAAVIMGSALHVISIQVNDPSTPAGISDAAAEAVLVMLGVDPLEAKRIAYSPIPS